MAEEAVVPQMLTLDLGLDLTTPKPAAAPGSLLSCLNYERGDAAGLARINGFEFYDGQTPADTSSFKILDFALAHDLVVGNHVGSLEVFNGQLGVIENLILHEPAGPIGTVKEGTTYTGFLMHDAPLYGVIEGSETTKFVHIGTVVQVVSTTRVVIACVNEDALRADIMLLKLAPTTGLHTNTGTITAVYDFNSIVYDVESNYTFRRQYADVLRGAITSVEEPCGMVWYNDALWAVAPTSGVTEATIGTFWRARSIQQLLDDNSGAAKVVGWQEMDLGSSLQNFPSGLQTAVNSLPTAKALELAQSKHQFIVANFFASEGTTKIYGVNGVSRAYEYDGSTFTFIDTGLSFEQDKPRHIAKFQDRLVLGYPNGSIVVSAVGQPTNFNGIDGAAEIAFGDRVVGLQLLAGEALGVFCENSVYYLDADLGVHVVSPNTGCIEYTLAAVDRPFYCSASGIMTIEQTSKYGEFIGAPISDKVAPWLRPRLKRYQGRYFSYPSVIGNMVVRNKNQYRLFFRDGYILTMTVTANGYVFTTQKYSFNEEGGENAGTFITIATCSQMSQDGSEKLFACHYNPRLAFPLNRVVELDVGWGFAGKPVEFYFETNAAPASNPFLYSKISKIRLHGLSKGKTSLKVQSSGTNDGYVDDYNTAQEQHLSLPRNSALFKDDFTNTTDIKDLADRGLSFKIKISGREQVLTEPPHVCQLITTLHKPGGKLDV